jgi:dipeptidyl aminopeptidase/acylaminoacyl peptidase
MKACKTGDTNALTAHDLVYGIRAAAEPQLSPDGERIVYALTQADPAAPDQRPQSRLWTTRRDGSDPAPLTDAGARDAHPAYSPDGTRIAFTSDRNGGSGVYIVPAAGGTPVEVARQPLGITGLAWAPDSRRIAYTVPVDPEDTVAGPGPVVRVTRRLDYKEDVRGYLGARRSQVFIVDAGTGGDRQISDGPDDHLLPAFSPDGRTIAYRVSQVVGMRSHLRLQDLETGGAVAIRIGDEESATISLYAFSPGGERILLVGDAERTSQPDLYLYSIATATVERITDGLDVLPHAGYPNSVPPSAPVWLDEERVLLHGVHHGASGLYELDLPRRRLRRLTDWQFLNVGLSTDRSMRFVVQAHTAPDSTGEISLFDRETGTTAVVTAFNRELLQRTPPAAWERFEIRRGDFTIESWVHLPPGFDPQRRYPLVLHVHGGPHSYHSYTFTAVEQGLAGIGVIVVSPNPRGSGSYGAPFATQVLRDWGGEDYLDLMAVVDAMCERPYVDEAHVGVYGYSYGGFMTSWIIGHTDRFEAAVCGAPCFDLVSMYGTSDITPVWGRTQWGGDPVKRPDWYREHSPSTYAHRATTPTLIIHGEADNRCPIGQGEEMFTVLHQGGCEVEFARYPGAAHLFLNQGTPAQREDVITRVAAWFRDHMAPLQD